MECPSANKTEEHEEEREAESEEELDDDIVSLARNVAGVAERRPDAEPWRSRVDDIFYSPNLTKLNFAISQETQMNEDGKGEVLLVGYQRFRNRELKNRFKNPLCKRNWFIMMLAFHQSDKLDIYL